MNDPWINIKFPVETKEGKSWFESKKWCENSESFTAAMFDAKQNKIAHNIQTVWFEKYIYSGVARSVRH